MKICVYCSSSSGLNEKYYTAAREFGRVLGRRGHSLVYGGYDRGVMGQVARGVAESGGSVTGVVPEFFNFENFAFPGAEIVRVTTMSERKRTMEGLADAFAVLPGGIGTLDELFEVLDLTALGQLHAPIAALDISDFFSPLREMFQKLQTEHFLVRGAVPMGFFSDPTELFSFLEISARPGSAPASQREKTYTKGGRQ